MTRHHQRRLVLAAVIASTTTAMAVACGSPPPPVTTTPPPPPLNLAPMQDAAAPIEAAAAAASSLPPKASAEPRYKKIAAELEASSFDDVAASTRAFKSLRDLADLRVADVLVRLLAREPPLPPRFRTQAALALGELGDLRALPALAWRLRQDPLKLYDATKDPDLRQDDNERVVSARYIADIITIHPEKRDEIAKTVEDSLFDWTAGKPEPHGNAMRAIGLLATARGKAKLRAWADTREPLPKPNQQSFPTGFATAQSALRHLGASERITIASGGKASDDVWKLLTKQLNRKPEKLDVTMDALMHGNIAVEGMALRALMVGAAYGFAEIGDPRAAPLLLKIIEDEKQNEQGRLEACFALAYASDDAVIASLPAKLNGGAALPPPKDLIRQCYLETLARRESAKTVPLLLPILLSRNAAFDVRLGVALAIGRAGLDASTTQSLLLLIDDPDLQNAAILALMLGADEASAKKAFDKTGDDPRFDDVKQRYGAAFSVVTDRDIDHVRLAHRVRNADECGGWAKQIASRSLKDVVYDAGPHSETRIVLRARLIADKSANARRLLAAMSEDASLEALGP